MQNWVIDNLTDEGCQKALVRTSLKMNYRFIDDYCVVKTDCGEVFTGIVVAHAGQTVILNDARSLLDKKDDVPILQIAIDGRIGGEKCKFTEPCNGLGLYNVIEIVPATHKGRNVIEGMEWLNY